MLVCRVLGSTEVQVAGVAVDLGGPLPRRLFTALVAAEGQPVPDDRLTHEVWGDDPPQHAVPTMQAYVSRLRRALGPDGRDLLSRGAAGYLLRLDPAGTDAAEFAAAVDDGRRLLADGHPREAVRVLAASLTLWRGDPYADLLASAAVDAVRGRLAELREVALEECLAARLAAGDAPHAVAELEAAVRVTPYRERRWALLILGLYRCGRQGEALAALRRARAVLADELGIDPGPELQLLEQQILAQDPHLLLAQAAPANPAPAPADGSARKLVRPLSSFLGRHDELSTVAALLAERRLVTLVGPAGVGKTRLAVEYAAGRPAGEDGWLVRLADAREPEVAAQAVADGIGLATVGADPAQAIALALNQSLAQRPGLLVLDNCEHLVGTVAKLAVELLDGCPELRILATSREHLGIDGEAIVPLGPLPLDADDGSAGSAVLLLLDRVQAVRPGWTASNQERAEARQVCAALDGMPLALELAAARARVLGLGEIADHLDDRFALLGSVPRGSLVPHATLSAAIGWSIDLLAATDRAMLLRLWPFEGGFSLEAAEAVRPEGSEVSMLGSVSALVTRSVVMADTTVTPTRYRLLETVRAYCEAADPDPAGTREAHARWVREFAARCAAGLRSERGGWFMRLLGRELPNLRAGITHDLSRHPELALRTIGGLDWFWPRSGHVGDGGRLAEAALRAAPDAPGPDRARGYMVVQSTAYSAGDLDTARALFADIFAAIGEPETDEERSLYGRALYRSVLGWFAVGDLDAAMEMAERTVAVGQRGGQDWLVASGQMMLGAALVLRGDTVDGEAMLVGAADLALRTGTYWAAAMSELVLAGSFLRRAAVPGASISDGQAALGALRRSLAWFLHWEDVSDALTVLHAATPALLLTGRPRDAARLRGAVRRHAAGLGVRPDRLDRLTGASALTVDGALPLAERVAAEAEGARLSWSQMVELLAP